MLTLMVRLRPDIALHDIRPPGARQSFGALAGDGALAFFDLDDFAGAESAPAAAGADAADGAVAALAALASFDFFDFAAFASGAPAADAAPGTVVPGLACIAVAPAEAGFMAGPAAGVGTGAFCVAVGGTGAVGAAAAGLAGAAGAVAGADFADAAGAAGAAAPPCPLIVKPSDWSVETDLAPNPLTRLATSAASL